MSTLVPLAVPEPKSSRHLPWSPVIGPDPAALIVQLNDTALFAPASSVAVTVGANGPAVELPWIARLTVSPVAFCRVPGLVIETESLMALVAAHPFAPLLNAALLHSASTANLPVDSVRLKAPPGLPGRIPAHLSPISPPEPSFESIQPLGGNGSVIVSAYSAPPKMLHPSLSPPGVGLTKSLPHAVPASGMYGRLVYGVPFEVAPWYAQYVPEMPLHGAAKPAGHVPDWVATTTWASLRSAM